MALKLVIIPSAKTLLQRVADHPLRSKIPLEKLHPTTRSFILDPVNYTSTQPDFQAKLEQYVESGREFAKNQGFSFCFWPGWSPELDRACKGSKINMLRMAMRIGTIEDVIELLLQNYLKEASDELGNPLPMAVRNFDLSLLFILFGASPDTPDANSNNIFHHIASGECLELFQVLRSFFGPEKTKEMLNTQNHREETPVFIACFNKDLSILDTFLEHGGSLAIPSKGRYPIHIAAQRWNTELVERICQVDPDSILRLNSSGQTPFNVACSVSYRDGRSTDDLVNFQQIVNLFLKYSPCHPGLIPDKIGYTSINSAAVSGIPEILISVIQSGDHNVDGIGRKSGCCAPIEDAIIIFQDSYGYRDNDEDEDYESDSEADFEMTPELALNGRGCFGSIEQMMAEEAAEIHPYQILIAVGASTDLPTTSLGKRGRKILRTPLSEEKIRAIRNRIWFEPSLASKLQAALL